MLATARLNLIPLTQADLPGLLKVYHDTHMMRHILTGQQLTAEEIQARAQNLIDSWQCDGFGYYKIITPYDEIIGYAGFRRLTKVVKGFSGYAELGYMIWSQFAGKGYATEAVQACVDVGFAQFSFASIVAVIDPGNRASMVVAQRVGMHHVAYDEPSQSDIYVAQAP